MVAMAVAPETGLAAEPTEYQLDDAIRVREDFGLRSDRSFVREAYANPSKYSDMSWGTPLSTAEAEDLRGRVQRVHDVRPAVFAAEKRDGFAGVYFDQLRGGVPVFLFSNGLSAAKAEIRNVLDGAGDFEVKRVERSMQDLTTVKRRVAEARDRMYKEGMLVTSVGYDIMDNVVEVGVANKLATAKTLLSEHGDAVRVVQEGAAVMDACNSAADCPSAKGGIKLVGTKSFCTAGFMGKRADGNSHLVLITAGHCTNFAQYSGETVWKHGPGSGETVGWTEEHPNGMYVRVWGQSQNPPYPVLPTDIGIIDLKGSFEPNTNNRNKLLMTNANPEVGSVDSWAYSLSTAFHGQGIPVCRMGAGSAQTSGYAARECGKVTQYKVDRLSCKTATGGGQWGEGPPCATNENTIQVSFDSTGGDSGGPYWMGNYNTDPPVLALGTHVHSAEDGVANKGWYTPLSVSLGNLYVREGANVYICIDNDC